MVDGSFEVRETGWIEEVRINGWDVASSNVPVDNYITLYVNNGETDISSDQAIAFGKWLIETAEKMQEKE